MEPNRREFIKQCAFQKFCNTVLHNEACDAHKELHRHKAKEITPCYLQNHTSPNRREFVKISFYPPLHGIIPTFFENAKNGRKKTGNLFLISCLGVPFYVAAVIQFLAGYNSTNQNFYFFFCDFMEYTMVLIKVHNMRICNIA